MKTSTKIWLGISGILLVALGILCICKPATTLFTAAWILGCFTLCAGIAKLIFTFNTQAFLPNSGSRALSSVLQIILGVIFLGNNLFVGMSLPIIFAMWVLFEGVVIAIQSLDYRHVFPFWWILLLLGVSGAILGILGLRNPDVSARTLSTLIGLGITALGAAYLFALCGVGKLERKVDGFRRAINIDEQ